MGKAKKKSPSKFPQKSKGGLFRCTSLRNEEIIAAVKPHWRTWTNAEEQNLLTISVAEALKRAESEQRKMSKVPDDTYKKNWGYAVAAPLDGNLIRAKDFLHDSLRLKEWRWSKDLDAKGFGCPRCFWIYAEHDCIEATLLEHLPWNNDKDVDLGVFNDLGDFLRKLYEKVRETKLERMAAAPLNSDTRCQGSLREDYRGWQEGVIMMILNDLQQSPFHIMYYHLQGCLEKAVKEEKLPQSKLGLQFDIYSASGFLQELTDDCITRLVEWLISKIDEFRSMAAKLLGGIKEWVMDPEPFALTWEDSDGDCFTVTAAWLQHLEVSKMDESALPGEGRFEPPLELDETGLQLEWIFGSVTSNYTGHMNQAFRPAGLELYTLENALDALEDALKSQQECRKAQDTARQVASAILLLSSDLQRFLELYPDMYKVQEERCSEDDRELPDNVLLFMLSRELNLSIAKLIVEHIARARAALTSTELREKLAEVSHCVSSLTFKRLHGQYQTPSNKFQAPKEEVFQERQTERNQEKHKLPTAASGSKGHRETEVNHAEKGGVPLAEWAGWVRATQCYLEAVVGAQLEALSAGKGGENIGKDPQKDEKARLKAVGNMLLGPPPAASKLTPTQVQWRKDLRKHFNKVIRPRLYLEKDEAEAWTAINKEINSLQGLIVHGNASLLLFTKQFENVAFSDMSAKLGHTIIPMFAERVQKLAKDRNWIQAEKAKQDPLQEEQAKVDKEEQKKAKKLRQRKAKQSKLEERTASVASENGAVTSKEADEAEELSLSERPSSLSLREEEPESRIAQEEGRPESQDGGFLRLLEHPDRHKKLVSEPSDPSLESHDAFVAVQKKNHRLKDHPLPKPRSHPQACTGDSVCCNDMNCGVAPSLPMPMSTLHSPSKRPVRPRPPVQ